MLELFITTFTLFLGFGILFSIPVIVHYLRFIMNCIQLVLIIFFLVTNNFYKNLTLWKQPNFQPIQQLQFSPLANILYYENEDENITEKFYFETSPKLYSIIPLKYFSKECFKNFYINELEACPILDIIIQDNQINIYKNYTELKIKNKYLYFTHKKELGKLYIVKNNNNININDLFLNFEKKIDNINLEIIARKEYDKNDNPTKPLKYFSKYFDFICLSLIIITIFVFWGEPKSERKCNKFKILNLCIEIIIFLVLLVRYILFIKLKKFLFENEDVYKFSELSEDYFPNRFYNFDSFPISISINIFLYYLFHFLLEKKFHLKISYNYNTNKCKCFKNKLLSINIIFLSLFICYLIIFAMDEKNYYESIKNDVKDILFNWKTSPINYIHQVEEENCNYILGKYNNEKIQNWKDNFFEVEKIQSINYLNLYSNKNGKKCGKDSFGNYLFFPDDYDCPINDILISGNKIEGYKKIPLNEKLFLYYTNMNTEGEIIIDIKISDIFGPQLNLDKINIKEEDINKCSSGQKFLDIPFFRRIDKSYNNKYLYLYSITYLGIDSSKINNSKDTFKTYIAFFELLDKYYFSKLIIYCCFILFTFIVFLKSCTCGELTVFPLILTIYIVIILMHLLSLIIHIMVIEKFLNKINTYFEEHKNSFIFDFFLLIINIIIFVCSFFLSNKNSEDETVIINYEN